MAANKKFTPRASSNLIEDEATNSAPVVTPEDGGAVVSTDPEVTGTTTPDDEEAKTPVVKADDEEGVTAPVASSEPETPAVKANEEENQGVTFAPETTKKPIEKMVKVRLAKKYDGCIGGVWYHFAKDQVVTVPENVKRILNSTEGMLKPL